VKGDLVLVSVDGAIATIELARAEKLNALNRAMLDQLDAACARIDADEAVRAVLVTSASRKAFCAGADIHEWAPLGAPGMWARWIRDGQRVFDRLARLRQPTIAVIDGIAYGGGLELALACDIRLAAATARFALPEVTIGAIPGWAGSQRLPRLIGAGRAKHMILSGQPIDAAAALAWGLVTEVLTESELPARALELARRIADNAPAAVQAAKQLVDASAGEGTATTLEALAAGFTAGLGDAQEGVAAFREKRPPKFTGR
jgi:enoyl-CoA hydratase/carnithine racemase